jgi:hypothetical protein
MRWLATVVVIGLTGSLACACSAWSAESKLREGGPTPYTRCLAAAPPTARSGRIGELAFTLRDRVLTLNPKRLPVRMAAFSSAGFGGPPRAAELGKLRQSGADVLLMLGGLGETEVAAEATAKALASLHRPVVLVLGGRDSWSINQSAVETLGDSGIINATTLRRVVIANNTLVPVAGADQGAYALNEGSCGFAGKDLEAVANELGSSRAAERRWLISWQAAQGRAALPSVARSQAGVDLGSARLGQFAERIGALGSLAAWPAGRQDSLPTGPLSTRLVPRLWGPRLERSDGARANLGLLSIELDDQGLRVVQ